MNPDSQVRHAPVKILIAEDSPTQSARLQHILELQAYEIYVAMNGRQALEMARQFRPAMIISDVVMPEMDGYELARRIKDDPDLCHTPMILVTSLSDPKDVIRGLESGADNFILKPYDEHYLLGRVRYVLANRATRMLQDTRMGMEIYFNGQKHFIEAERLQILNLLLSTYEAATRRNAELIQAQDELSRTNVALSAANRQLEQQSREREQAETEVIKLNRTLEQLITERTNALHRSERAFSATFERAAVGIAHIGLTGRFVRVNPRLSEMSGYTEAELRQKKFSDVVHPDDVDSVRDILAPMLQGETGSITLERRLVHRNGDIVWIHCTISQVHDQSGGIAYLLGFIEDVSTRKCAEQALVMSRTLLNETRQIAHVGGWELDIDTGVTLWTEEIYAIHDLDPAAHHDINPGFSFYTPESRRLIEQAIEDAIANGTPFDLELEITPAANQRRWVHSVGKIDPVPRKIYGAIQDITARKQAELALLKLNEELEDRVTARTAELDQANVALAAREEEIRSVVDHMVDCVITIDEKGIIRSANQVVEKIFGYTTAEVIGRNVSMLMVELERADHDGYIEHYQTTGIAKILGIERQVEGLHKNGERIALNLAISEYTVQGQRYFTGILRDIRERVRIIRDLERARHDAEHANQAKSLFLAAMSHEIRTPMNGVIGMADVLQQTSLKGHQMEMVNLMRESAFALLTIIDDILDFSKIEAGKLELESAPVSIAEVVEKACGILDRVAAKKGVELTLFTDPKIPALLLGDGLRLRQILVNLINNAIKFSSGLNRAGRVSVRAELTALDAQHVTVLLRVIDNGIGIDEATAARLFTSFTQADASTTRRFGGTGLGLAISRHLVALMNGAITLESTPGVGTIFTVRLPLPATVPPAAPSAATDLSGLSCLILGDNDGIAGDLAIYLDHCGAQVERASSLDQACRQIETSDTGSWLFIVDTKHGVPPIAKLRAAYRARVRTNSDPAGYTSTSEPYFVLINRGRRRHERSEANEIVTLDGNVMTRRTFLHAVAVAAGRAEVEQIEAVSASIGQRVAPTREQALRQHRLILVAEDNETNQKVIRQQFALLGVAVDITSDGREALKRWRRTDYAMLFTDLHMPEMDGYDLAGAIRTIENGQRRIPIVALTANALKGEDERCRAAGMDDYLSKPAQLTDLKATLEKWLPGLEAASGAHVLMAAQARSASTLALDPSVLEALVGDDPEIIREFLEEFRNSAVKTAMELKTACELGQAGQTGALAHKLKSSARAVGAIPLGDLCAELEHAGNQNLAGQFAALLASFELELEAVKQALEVLLSPSSQQPAPAHHDPQPGLS